MGVHVVKVPDVGEGVAEVELVSWAVALGQRVARNEVLAEVMTDKANVEIPSPVSGVIAALNGEIGSTMAVGSSLIELTVEGAGTPPDPTPATTSPPAATADAGSARTPPGAGNAGATTAAQPASAGGGGAGSSEEAAAGAMPPPSALLGSAEGAATVAARGARRPASASGVATVRGNGGVPRPEGQRARATPAVRHRAREAGVDLRRVPGTGPSGRITHEDLDRFFQADTAGAGAIAPGGSGLRSANTAVSEEPIVGIRRKIAEHMVASTSTIPHITYVEEVDVTAVEELRATLNDRRLETQPRLTLLPFLVRALVRTLPDFGVMNAHVDDDRGVLTTFGAVHVGIATQTPNGLVVPVIRHAESLSIWSIAEQLNSQAEAARGGRSAPSDLRGSTITITSLGALGGLVTTPVINKPEVAIVGVNKIATRPVVVDTAIVARQIMNLSCSFDHRVVDGWDAASFVQAVRICLEQPAMLFIDEA